MLRFLAAYVIAAAVVATALPANAEGHKVFAIATQNSSGELGTVTLIPLGDKTRVEVALANTPDAVAQPAHIHVGPCAKLDPKPLYPLTPVFDGRSVTVVSVPIAKLLASPMAVNVHKSATEIAKYVACGDLAK